MADQTARLSGALIHCPEQTRKTAPLIHCITNYVTAGDVANLLLAVGASPVMTDHPAETASTASASDGLVLNLGTLKIGSVTAMIRAGRTANRKGIPIVFDPVGIGVSAHRRHAARRILSHISVSIVRGNSSEIRTLANLFGYPVGKEQHGVDAVSTQTQDTNPGSKTMEAAKISERLRTDAHIARFLSKKLQAVIICTGPCDLVVFGSRTARIHNGCLELAQITGSGCMMDGLLAAFAAAASAALTSRTSTAPHPTHTGVCRQKPFIYFYPAICAVTEIGLCGEKAAAQMRMNGTGLGSFHVYFMDAISQMTGEQLQGGQKIEISAK